MKTTRNTYNKNLLIAALVVGAFLIGLVIPSPFFKRVASLSQFDGDAVVVRDTTNMVMPDGSVYEGSINAKTKALHGFGVLKKGNSTYEGNWKDGRLPFGKRTTPQSEYEGKFDNNLNNNGFGVIRYTDSYVNGKRRQGIADADITTVYAGNWSNNLKNGIGRSEKVDGSMEFGNYKDGEFQKVDGAAFNVGDRVYGIDVSHHNSDISWDQLALYCDKNGLVYSGKPKETKYMQPVMFAYMKATEGATFKDRTYDVRQIEAERHGIAKGAYHFLRMGSSVEDQVKNFIETANWSVGDMPPALDVELEDEIVAHGVDKFLDTTFGWLEAVEEQMNVRPIIYTRESIRDKYLARDPRFAKYQCWIARYHPDGPKKDDWKLWQMSESAVIGGHDGKMDVNLFNDNYNAFREYLNSREVKPSEN